MRVFLCLLLLSALASCKKDDGDGNPPLAPSWGSCDQAGLDYLQAYAEHRKAECLGADTTQTSARVAQYRALVAQYCGDPVVALGNCPLRDRVAFIQSYDCSHVGGLDSLLAALVQYPQDTNCD